MDYFVYAAASLAILVALTSLLVRTLNGPDRRRQHSTDPFGRRAFRCGFVVAGAGIVVLISATVPSFHKGFEFGIIAALGAVMIGLGIGYALGVRVFAAARRRRRRARPVRAVPRLSDL